MLTDQDRGVLRRLTWVWPTYRQLFKASLSDLVLLEAVFKDTKNEFEVGLADRVQQKVERLLVLNPRTDTSLCELGAEGGPQFFLSAFTALFWISNRARVQLQIPDPIDVESAVEKLDQWLSSQQFNVDDMRKINERLRREALLLGFHVDDELPSEMSKYRTPKEWQAEFKKAGLSNSATTWRRRRDAYGAKREGNTYAFSKIDCEKMGLSLPEFALDSGRH